MKLLISCVNSAVALVGYDLVERQVFWYCPGNTLRTCGVCADERNLWVASDNTLTTINANGVKQRLLPGPHDNLAHSVKVLGGGIMGLADTGNSRVLMMPDEGDAISCSPLEGWEGPLPPDAIHLNDIIPWRGGILASAFHYQPFQHLKKDWPAWNKEGLGVIFHIRRQSRRTISTIAASGLNCPHSLVEHEKCVYCCSSSTGELYHFEPRSNGTLCLAHSYKITDTHFLRGCMRVGDGWLMGGSTRRHVREGAGGGMVLFHLDDSGRVTQYPVAPLGEIYDIIPWNSALMRVVTPHLLTLPDLPLEGEFPPRCMYIP